MTTLLTINNLSIAFPTDHGLAMAVNNLNLSIQAGEILGLVGESGCGKSLSSLAILRLVPKPGKIVRGTLTFQGKNLLDLSEEEIRQYRGAKIAMIPQDPLTSLNPVYTIGNQIMEVLQLHQGLDPAAARQRAIELLEQVRLPNARERIDDYPHQFSGGMRQRVMIAMALSCEPTLLIADEPTTALDVTVQKQILTLMQEIRETRGTAILIITHDLGVVAEICDQVAVMYAGRLVEQAEVHELFNAPKHPYTQGLLNSLPTMQKKRLEPIEGHPPSLTEIPLGCAFEPRCNQRMEVCSTAFPNPSTLSSSHQVQCYLYPQSEQSPALSSQ